MSDRDSTSRKVLSSICLQIASPLGGAAAGDKREASSLYKPQLAMTHGIQTLPHQ